MTIRISIDCMGGDHGVSVTIPACVSFVKSNSDAELVLVGKEELIRNELNKLNAANHPRLTIKHASDVVEMDDPLEVAMRKKRDSSMRVAIELVKDTQVQACVSAGNTGALMAISRYLLRTLPGVERPAICTILPNQKNGPTYMLDLGANVDCEPEHLRQFARMASALVSSVEGKSRPTVGLLNVGTEEIKGNEVVKQASDMLREDHAKGVLNYYGNVEGNDIFEGTTDIVVCDGFVGNVALKTAEGLGRFFRVVVTSEFKSGIFNMLGALIAMRALKSISKRMNPSRFNGASLLGLRGLVFKSHGSADAFAYEYAIKRAYDAVKHDVLLRISNIMAELLPTKEPQVSSVAATPFEQETA
jgi:phosphate acyltransferase